MRSDIERWEKKYSKKSELSVQQHADPLLVSHKHLLNGTGLAIDLAAGTCGTSIHLARSGYSVIALDCSLTALKIGQHLAIKSGVFVQGLVIDLDDYLLPKSTFNLITCFRYLNRRLFPMIKWALNPGGQVVYKTFNQNHLEKTPGFAKEYLLRPGELAEAFEGLQITAYDDGVDSQQPYSYIIAQAPK